MRTSAALSVTRARLPLTAFFARTASLGFLCFGAFLCWHPLTSHLSCDAECRGNSVLDLLRIGSTAEGNPKLLITMMLRTTPDGHEASIPYVAGYSPLSCRGRGKNDAQEMVGGS